jgi:hypothetical protein
MAYQKTRLEKLERSMIPPGAFMVVWEDPEKKGVYYDSPPGSLNRKAYTEGDLKPLRDSPDNVLFVVTYTDDWKCVKNRIDSSAG